MMSVFEKIVVGEIPCHKIWEDSEHLAFLDIRPVSPGHTLVIPKKKVDPIFAMEDAPYQRLLMAAKKVAELLKSKVVCERVCMAVLGFEVPHAHIHLIPCRSIADLHWPAGKPASRDDLLQMQQSITQES